MATKHVSDLRKTQEQILLDLVNAANGTNLPLSALTITKASDGANRAASASLTSKKFTGYKGSQTVSYRQIDFDETLPMFVEDGKVIPADGVTATVAGILNAALGLDMRDGDLNVFSGDQALNFTDGHVNFFQITANEDSLIWDGEIEFEIACITVDNVPSYRVRFAPIEYGMGVMPPTTNYDESGAIQVSEDGKIITG